MNNAAKAGWPLNIFKAIAGEDFDFNISEKRLNNLLCVIDEFDEVDSRIKTILYAYYKDYRSICNIGEEMVLSRERVNQLRNKGLRFLRYPRRRNRFLPPVNTLEEVEELYKYRMDLLMEKERIIDAKWAKFKRNSKVFDIEDLDLSVRLFNSLARAGYETTEDIVLALNNDPTAIVNLRNMGAKSYNELLAKLDEYLNAGKFYMETYNMDELKSASKKKITAK